MLPSCLLGPAGIAAAELSGYMPVHAQRWGARTPREGLLRVADARQIEHLVVNSLFNLVAPHGTLHVKGHAGIEAATSRVRGPRKA